MLTRLIPSVLRASLLSKIAGVRLRDNFCSSCWARNPSVSKSNLPARNSEPLSPRRPRIFALLLITSCENTGNGGIRFSVCNETMAFFSSSKPLRFEAWIAITGIPNFSESFLKSILTPEAVARSTILNANITGKPVSKAWVARYKFLSRFEASAITSKASGTFSSGFNPRTNSTERSSSGLRGARL